MTVLVPACLGAVGVGSANREYRPSQLEGKAANEISQHLRSVIMAALCETAEAVAATGVRDVVALNSGKTKQARPKHVQSMSKPKKARPANERGERAHPHADTAGVLERLIVQAEGRGAGDLPPQSGDIEPHASGPGDAVEEGGRGPSAIGASASRGCSH
jgi:hypothetical protein